MKEKITEFEAKRYPANIEWFFGTDEDTVETHTTMTHDGSGDKFIIRIEYIKIMDKIKKYQLRRGICQEIYEELRFHKSNSYN